jgi:hypothetical protein
MIYKLKTFFRDLIYMEDSIRNSRVDELVRLHKKNKFKAGI